MRSVKLDYSFFRGGNDYSRELCVWTRETNYQYYPLSYSLRDCFELICEKLGWEYEQYESRDRGNGVIHAMKPEPKLDMSNCWDGANSTGDYIYRISGGSGDTIYRYSAGW